MTAYVVYGDRNFDTCYTAAGAVAAPSGNATLDSYTINGAKLTINTDTRYAPGRNGSVAAAGTGSLDTVTVSASLGGEVLVDGTSVRLIPYVSGTGTPNVQSPGLYTSALSWSAGVVTVTTSAVHSYTTGDWVSIGGAEPNGYNGVFQITVTTTTTFTYELANDPGISTVTNATAVKYWHVRQLQTTPAVVTAAPYGSGVVTYTSTSHGLVEGDWVRISAANPSTHNGLFQISGVTTNTFNVARTVNPGDMIGSSVLSKCAQGFFLGFWSALNVAANPQGMVTAAAVAATGFLKVKGVKGSFIESKTVTLQATAATSCMAAGPDIPGWIEVCGASTGIMTVPRLGKFTAQGAWFYPQKTPQQTTSVNWASNALTLTFAYNSIGPGEKITISNSVLQPALNGTWTVVTSNATQIACVVSGGSASVDAIINITCESRTTGVASATGIQLPASTALTYYAGVWVETAVGSETYEFYPSAGSYATAGVSTNAALGKVCWITTQGAVRFGHNGTVADGYLPPAGLRIRVPNINFINTTRAATPGVGPNIANTATLTARQTFVSTGGNTGVININKANSNWYLNFVQTSSVTLTDVGVTEGINFSEIAAPYTFNNVGVGQSLALSVQALTQAMCFAGGTETNCTWSRAALGASGNYIGSRTDVFNLTISGEKSLSVGARANNTTGAWNLVRLNDSTYTNTKVQGGQFLLTTCSNITMNTTEYSDSIQTTAITTFPQYVFSTTTNCSNLKFDGVTHAGNLATSAAYNGILYTAIGCNNVKLRNIGSTTTPLDLGSRGAYIYSSGTGASGGCSSIEVKRVYTANTRTGVFTADNSLSGLLLESVWGDEADTITGSVLNCQVKGVRGAAVTTGQTAVYGSHWQDFVYSAGNTGKVALTFNEETSAYPSSSTVTRQQLNLPAGFNSVGVIQMPLLNDEVTWETPYRVINHASFTVAAPTIISTTALTMTAGTWAANYTTITCGTHGLTAGDTIVITGAVPAAYNGVFTITNIVSATQVRYYQATTPGTWTSGGNILPLDNLNIFYYLDNGAGYGTKRNLKLTKTGGVTTSGNAILTMTDTTGIEVGDYVTSKVAGAGASTRVLSIDSGTQVTVNVNSSATTAANVLYFNHLPFESAISSTGFKIKLNVKSWANCNTAAITNIAIPTITSATTRAYQYPLDTNTLSLTGLVDGSDIIVTTTGTNTPLQDTDSNPGTTWSWQYSGAQTVDIGIIKAGYVPLYIRGLALTTIDRSLPISQVVDRNYLP